MQNMLRYYSWQQYILFCNLNIQLNYSFICRFNNDRASVSLMIVLWLSCTPNLTYNKQCFGSGWIALILLSRIRIFIGNADPYPGARKLTQIYK